MKAESLLDFYNLLPKGEQSRFCLMLNNDAPVVEQNDVINDERSKIRRSILGQRITVPNAAKTAN